MDRPEENKSRGDLRRHRSRSVCLSLSELESEKKKNMAGCLPGSIRLAQFFSSGGAGTYDLHQPAHHGSGQTCRTGSPSAHMHIHVRKKKPCMHAYSHKANKTRQIHMSKYIHAHGHGRTSFTCRVGSGSCTRGPLNCGECLR